ncbi:hypothetical protein MMAN_04530 [Mycobacterium mantenii]|uniref:Uncharacterized protein n=1 Tax=Mycobacterium mantenii TaxID=560555 RepID=A0A1X0F6A9_MYCNT|nr:hypothetical protein [Mycobacterium mantenii]MCV7241183.1 hypothetical protein [Mycobacterium mantenii]ORA96937.1 hypothetical protein BST30_28095 [Mycobacterium mantenii]BBY36319.1 hypothetical protein MMAN_04530 [Mycobacterium mantenii]
MTAKRRLAPGRRLRADMDAALQRAGQEAGEALEFDERELAALDTACDAANRAEELRGVYRSELAGEARPTVLSNMSAEIRHCERLKLDALAKLALRVEKPKSGQHQQAAKYRWDRKAALDG